MAKKQTRRSISVKGITYKRLKNYCEAQGVSISGYLEEILADKLDEAKVPVPTVLEPRKPNPGKVEPEPEPEPVEVEITTTQEFADHYGQFDTDKPRQLPVLDGHVRVSVSTSQDRQTGDHKKWE